MEGREAFTEDGRPRVKASDWITTVPFLLAFVSTLVAFDCLQRPVTVLFGRNAHEQVNRWLNRALVAVIKLSGATVTLTSHPDVPSEGPVIVVSNHQSLMDIPYLTTLLPHLSPRFISKLELAKWLPYVSYVLRSGGHALIDRKNPGTAVGIIKDLARNTREWKTAAVIFPEGTRARRGGLGNLKRRGFLTLLEELPEAPVVTVAINNAWKLAAYKLMPAPRGVDIRATVIGVMPRSPDEDRRAMTREIFNNLKANVRDAAPELDAAEKKLQTDLR